MSTFKKGFTGFFGAVAGLVLMVLVCVGCAVGFVAIGASCSAPQ